VNGIRKQYPLPMLLPTHTVTKIKVLMLPYPGAVPPLSYATAISNMQLKTAVKSMQ